MSDSTEVIEPSGQVEIYDKEFHPDENPELSMATQFIPWPHDDPRTKYLGCIACGFSVREALHYPTVDRTKSWLSEQRKDPAFVEAEKHMPEIRRTLSREFINLETIRNYRLVLLKDHQIFTKATRKDEILTRQEQEYLIKARGMYTPQQLEVIDSLTKESSGEEMNFAEWVTRNQDVIQMSRTKESVTIKRGSNGQEI